MKGFIEVNVKEIVDISAPITTEINNKMLIKISKRDGYFVVGNTITIITPIRELAIVCQETYEEIKKKIKEAQEEK